MRLLTKSILSAALMLSVFMVSSPARASQLSTTQINAILGLLQSFGADASVINNIQTTLTGGTATTTWTASSTPWNIPPGQVGKMMCIVLNRNLGIGSRGDDVKNLQDWLHDNDEDHLFTATSTGYFGPLTAKVMAHYQIKWGIASSSSGTVGPLTRGFFERRCGQGLSDSHGNGGDTHGNGNGNNDNHHASSTPDRPQMVAITSVIASSTGSTITVTKDGQPRIVNILPSTTINVFVVATSTASSTGSTSTLSIHLGTTADLVVGVKVLVQGMVNANGTVDATEIRVNYPYTTGGGDH